MDTLSAFAMGEANRGKPLMVFDWDKAAAMIAANNAQQASAGLCGDWKWTGGDILRDGVPIPADDTYVFLASTWATPQLILDDGEPIDCFRMVSDSPGWNSGTYWPDSALALLAKATADQ